jgi:hypothetical protein
VEGLTAERVIRLLRLQPLPGEGGWFREIYRRPSPDAARGFGTVIHYLLTAATFSALHVLDADEIYHFLAGDALELTTVNELDELTTTRLGADLGGGDVPQFVVPAGVWQGSRVAAGGAWSLVGTTVVPAFEFSGCRLAMPADLDRWPMHRSRLQSLLAPAGVLIRDRAGDPSLV